MSTYTPKRRARGEWIVQVDWRDLSERAMRAVVVIGWLGFVAAMLALALERAP